MNKLIVAGLVAVGMYSIAACDESAVPSAQDRTAKPAAPPTAPITGSRPELSSNDQVAELTFDSIDRNKDGVITPTEALIVPGLDFTSADTNGDLTLSRDEFDAAMARRPRG